MGRGLRARAIPEQQLAGSNISDVLNSDLHHIQELRNAVARNYRVFRRIIFVGLLVGTSIIVDLVVIWANDANYLGLAIWTFVASLVLLGYVLLWEVLTTFLRSGKLLRAMDKAAREGDIAYRDMLQNQPPKK